VRGQGETDGLEQVTSPSSSRHSGGVEKSEGAHRELRYVIGQTHRLEEIWQKEKQRNGDPPISASIREKGDFAGSIPETRGQGHAQKLPRQWENHCRGEKESSQNRVKSRKLWGCRGKNPKGSIGTARLVFVRSGERENRSESS